jgi:CHAT domain-containing protein
VTEVQRRLDPGDALILFYSDNLEVGTWVVTGKISRYFSESRLAKKSVVDLIVRLREALDLSEFQNEADIPLFDTAAAYELYQLLLGQARPALAGVKHLYVVLDASLRSLPLSLLVSEPPARDLPDGDYRAVHWLARDYAITVLPTVASLRSLEMLRRQPHAVEKLIAFADPVLLGKAGRQPARGGKLLRQGDLLASPEETAVEVQAVAEELGASPDDLYLGERATEGTVKTVPLQNFGIVYFATHALLPEENTLAQPAIVLTPPATATAEDDGLLTADEIAGLRINADWVVLSACNTVGPLGRGLSGLARAFLFAGAKALLVSHWYVARAPSTWHQQIDGKRDGAERCQ